jgi:hypothetical protein
LPLPQTRTPEVPTSRQHKAANPTVMQPADQL